jgi:hypothetical protein
MGSLLRNKRSVWVFEGHASGDGLATTCILSDTAFYGAVTHVVAPGMYVCGHTWKGGLCVEWTGVRMSV